MRSINENLELIKNQIKNGVTKSSKNLTDTEDINKLHREYLALESVKSNTKSYELQKKDFNERLDELAKRLNIPFIEEQTTSKIMGILSFEGTVSEKLTGVELDTYNHLIKNKFPFDDIKKTLEGSNFNIYQSLAELNGYKNIFEYQKAKADEKDRELKILKEKEDRQARIDEMKEAYREALKEHQDSL